MPLQEIGGATYGLWRHKRDHRVQYWARLDSPVDDVVQIRATQNMLHPEWDEVPLEFTVDGGTMPHDAFMSLYEKVEV